MNKPKILFLVLAVSSSAIAIATQVKKRGGVKPVIEDLKAGAVNAVGAGKKSLVQLVADNTGKAGVKGQLVDEQRIAYEQATGTQG